MKKAIILLAVAILILLFPVVVYANSAVPSPYDIDIAVYDYSQVISIDIYGSMDTDEYELIKTVRYTTETRRKNERIVDFYNDEGTYKSFMLVVEITNGTQIQSNPVDIEEWGQYTYDVEKNVLAPGEITSWKLGFGSLIVVFTLGLPLAVTLVAEWLISVAFRLDPGKYVVIANLITNSIMNILIVVLFNNFMLNYWLILLMLEIAVAALEFLFYIWCYKEFSKKRLAIFAVTANIASWGLYYFVGSYMF